MEAYFISIICSWRFSSNLPVITVNRTTQFPFCAFHAESVDNAISVATQNVVLDQKQQLV
jgi:hypothetical protein